MNRSTSLNSTHLRMAGFEKERLQRLSELHGVKISDLIREAVAAKLPVWERDGVFLGRDAE